VNEKRHDRYRSLFWPTVLIGVGLIALLGNLGLLARANIFVLFRLWPLLLILVGLDLMFGRRSPAIGALIGIAAVALVIGLMLVGPSLGLSGGWEIKTSTLIEPIGEATSARVNLNLSTGSTLVTALSDSPNLFEAQLKHLGKIKFDVRGEREKTLRLSQHDGVRFFWFDAFDDDDELHWDIGLNPRVPLELEVDGGSGASTLDLGALQLTRLQLDVGSGAVEAHLPATERRYEAQVDGGSGSCRLDVAGGAGVDMEIDVGSGSVRVGVGSAADVNLRAYGGSGYLSVKVPPDAAVRVDVRDSGSGRVRVHSRLQPVREGTNGDEGTWETPGFEDADHKITIVIEDVGSGDVEVSQG
jgi:hypothetical protein